ncbi:tRNA (adenosine(37)-N6)-threonylcarbamoyltransferase complex dimerization subunit type 1 TsaB [Fulvivirgaceae bacterium BMA10]|uniref:tRNA (Adenosine(37)-N6)-threonylcarbamoyltransferase complex dimerization subunit type 1 TsaB n=1 Tax=Splendidivirga corallicola TaxID=3051826 RepID=A0ABT8KWB2_9BACT|nr:tRNA (adenosine(37)-N6)-threonylcarbamoyltransferase complex dimerization subunit type 1 TsaB [Fulvivirgaceae bacterium BMA10]
MSLILSIETATRVCSVALHQEGVLLASQELFLEKSHSGLLTQLIQEVTTNCDMSLSDLDAVAISKGPGSYTGLRIGTSTAKGLCYGLDIPLIGIDTLQAMGFGMRRFNVNDALLCPMIDARRMEVYCLVMDSSGELKEKTQARIIDESSFSEYLDNRKMIFFGDGAHKGVKLWGDRPNVQYIKDIFPSAIYVGHLAYECYQKEHFEDLAYFEPFYLKDFRAIKPKVS